MCFSQVRYSLNLKGTEMSKATELADELHKYLTETTFKAAKELRRLDDLLGKANALCRIRKARIKELATALEDIAAYYPNSWAEERACSVLLREEETK
jgi:hypothetical protein